MTTTDETPEAESGIWLVCKTTDLTDMFGRAVMGITPTQAKGLLNYREHWRRVHAFDNTLYCLEFFDSRVEYGEKVNVKLPEDSAWRQAAEEPELDNTLSRTSAECMMVTGTGILWSASAKHSDDYFETPEISWDDLLAISQGKPAFGKPLKVKKS